MGISIQEYRLQIGCYNGSANWFKPSRRTFKENTNRSAKPNLKYSFTTILICLIFVLNTNYRNVYESNSAFGYVHYIDQNICQNGAARVFMLRSCSFLTKSTVTEDFNFLARYTHGNIRGSGLRLCHWNKGGSYLINCKNEIEQVIDQYRPHVLGISESNFYSNHSLDDVQIENYNLYFSKTLKNPNLNISRVAVYVHTDVVVTVRNDLMTDNVNSVWLEVGIHRQKKFLVSNIYREWQYLGQADQASGSIASQISRWESFLQKWEEALALDLEIHVLGDMNLNFLDFHTINPTHSSRLPPL